MSRMKIVSVHYHMKLAKTTHNYMLTTVAFNRFVWINKDKKQKKMEGRKKKQKKCHVYFGLFEQTVHFKFTRRWHFYRCEQQFPWNICSNLEIRVHPESLGMVRNIQKWKQTRDHVIDTNYIELKPFTTSNQWNRVKHPIIVFIAC